MEDKKLALENVVINNIAFDCEFSFKDKTNFTVNLNYETKATVDPNKIVAEMKLLISCTDAEKNQKSPMHMEITITGFFTNSNGLDKEIIRVRSYELLFPYIQAYVKTITSLAGAPPLTIPFFSIDQIKPIIK
ncbi:MAG: protein-export chaperone SecB [Eubacteriaceae bacterium]|nr:protein-export chaperone SecB [Eubacteriaceae bacterium]